MQPEVSQKTCHLSNLLLCFGKKAWSGHLQLNFYAVVTLYPPLFLLEVIN